MKKKLVTTLLASALSASMIMPAFATGTEGGAIPYTDGTQVWAGVILEDIDAKVKVEVPTLFAFVVNGTVDATDTSAISAANGSLLLPNVKVNVTTPSATWNTAPGTAVYEVQTVGQAYDGNKLPFTNYSTYDADPTDTHARAGLKVKINGNIKNEGTDVSRNYWTHVSSTKTSNAAADFKNYNINIDGNNFDTAADGGLQMASGIALAAPTLDMDGDGTNDNIDANNQFAVVGETHYAAFGVSVGGERQQYKQVEQSAKVGTIVWTISAEIEEDVYTAPENDYLDGDKSTNGAAADVDPDNITY